MRSTCLPNENSNPIQVNIAVVGLSGSSQLKGVSGIGKSSLCNRLVRPQQNQKPISALSSVDFYSDIINGTHWIYWDYAIKTIDSKVYAFHIIEETILINDQTFGPFENFSESEYISRAISAKLSGSKRAYICASQLSQSLDAEASLIQEPINIDAFLLVYDISEVHSRNYQAQDQFLIELLNGLLKNRKPVLIIASKTDIVSPKIRTRLDLILEKRNYKSIPLIETSAKMNINVSQIFGLIGSLLTTGQKTLSFNSTRNSLSIESYTHASKKHQEQLEKCLANFKDFVSNRVKKTYDFSWEAFCSTFEYGAFLATIDRSVLQKKFEIFRSAAINEINEKVTELFIVLFKNLIIEFVDPMLATHDGDNTKMVDDLLNNPQFLSRFTEADLPYDEIMKNAHLKSEINYPLPRYFITFNNSHNKLKTIGSCIEELKSQKRISNLSENFLSSLRANRSLYLKMSFSDIEKIFKGDQIIIQFRASAKLVFDEFIENEVKQFKNIFDEKLLELSFYVYSIEPMKLSIQKNHQKKKFSKDNNLEMDIIKSIDNQIVLESDLYKNLLFDKQRINWIVKYIGSILSTNPNQCYIFDFKPRACWENLKKYMNPISHYIDNVLVVISGDKTVDEIWKENKISTVDLNIVSSDNTYPSPIQFFSSNQEITDFYKTQFSGCQKIVFLISEDSIQSHDTLNHLLKREIVNNVQLSIINLSKHSDGSNHMLIDVIIKRWDIKYSIIGWSLCPGQHLKKLLNEQTNSHLFNTEPTIIWIVIFCADTYDNNIPLSFFLSMFQDYIVTDQTDDEFLSFSLFYILPNFYLPQRIKLSIVSYHQAVKLLTENNPSPNPHILIYFSYLFRLASINTMFSVMQNLLNLINIKSVMCTISSSRDHDSEELSKKRSIITELNNNNNIDCIFIEDDDESNESNFQKLWSHICECAIPSYHMDENKNLWCYNNAFENDENRCLLRMKTCDNSDGLTGSKECSKYRFRGEISKENIINHKPCFGHSHLLNRSNSQHSSDAEFNDTFIHCDKNKKWIEQQFTESFPLGCCNEDLFKPITEESSFDETLEIEDNNTAIYINCTNLDHISQSSSGKNKSNISNKKSQASKIRSYSGPVQTNKSFSKKYSEAQVSITRSQRLTKKSQSLNTSPSASGMKPLGQCEHCKSPGEYCICFESSQNNNNSNVISTTSSKSLKNMISRFFSSERYSSKSAEERRSLFRRSIKFPKRNSDRKPKTIPIKSGSDPQPPSSIPDAVCLPLSHSISHSILDMRKRSKSILPLKNV